MLNSRRSPGLLSQRLNAESNSRTVDTVDNVLWQIIRKLRDASARQAKSSPQVSA